MKFVLSGVETNNKGAELMLYAILQEIERRYPYSTVYFDMGSIRQGLSYLQTTLTLKEKPIEKIRKWNKYIHFIGLAIRLKVPPILFEDIYAISGTKFFFDASGFLFSDQWKWPKKLKEQKKRLWDANRKAGVKLVFLPQAFGPFNESYSRECLSVLADYANIIMPRDNLSYRYLIDSELVDGNKVKKYPDFTSLVEGTIPKELEYLKGNVCIIPNMRMIDKGVISLDNYISFLSAIIKMVQNEGHSVYLLNHEGKDDENLIYKCQEALGGKLEIVLGLNALEVKGMISSACLVVTSRFHGAVSALNSCVPCLATSWSHKYSELFKDYGMSGCILPIDCVEKSLNIIKQFLNKNKNMEIRNELNKTVPLKKEMTHAMWEVIWNLH